VRSGRRAEAAGRRMHLRTCCGGRVSDTRWWMNDCLSTFATPHQVPDAPARERASRPAEPFSRGPLRPLGSLAQLAHSLVASISGARK